MGMLLTHHKGYRGDAPEVDETPEVEPETPEPSVYDGLTDDELLEAYVTNVDPDPEADDVPTREDMVAALEALDAEAGESEEHNGE